MAESSPAAQAPLRTSVLASPAMGIQDTLGKLLRAVAGDITAMGQLAEEASGGHVANFFKTQDEVLKEHLDVDTRDGFLLLAKQVACNSTSILVVLEILNRMVADKEAAEALEKLWEGRKEPRPSSATSSSAPPASRAPTRPRPRPSSASTWTPSAAPTRPRSSTSASAPSSWKRSSRPACCRSTSSGWRT